MHLVLDALPQARDPARAVIVIGVGNEFRHDDAAGLVAARRLRERGIPAEEHDGDPAALIERWQGIDGLILIDAVQSSAPAGALHVVDASASPLDPELFKNSTHALGLADAVELSRTLGTLPPHVLVFGIEARDVTAGVGLSPEVEGALRVLIDKVLRAL
jgi:hydrogenase maturation protease